MQVDAESQESGGESYAVGGCRLSHLSDAEVEEEVEEGRGEGGTKRREKKDRYGGKLRCNYR